MDKSVKYIIRHIKPEETILLKDFLYEAIYIPEGIKPPSRDIVFLPELKIYFEENDVYPDGDTSLPPIKLP